jgi:hypothetical protein
VYTSSIRGEIHIGHILTWDPERVSAVKEFPTPKNVKEVRVILGLAGCYTRFAPRFANDQTIDRTYEEGGKVCTGTGAGGGGQRVINEFVLSSCVYLFRSGKSELLYTD